MHVNKTYNMHVNKSMLEADLYIGRMHVEKTVCTHTCIDLLNTSTQNHRGERYMINWKAIKTDGESLCGGICTYQNFESNGSNYNAVAFRKRLQYK